MILMVYIQIYSRRKMMNKELSDSDIDEIMFAIEQEVYDMGRTSLCEWAIKGMSNYYRGVGGGGGGGVGWITEEDLS